MMRLASPAWLLLVVAAGLCVAVWLLRRRWQRYPHPGPLASSTRGRLSAAATVLAGVLAAAALLPLAVAAARPQEILSRQLEHAEGVDIAIVLDVSRSMAAQDLRPSDRLGVAKEVIGSFLARRSADRFALVAFAGAAVTLCPLTLDHEVARFILDRVEIGALPDGTAIGLGLGTAVNRLRGSAASSKVVILVTDGSNNIGQLDPLTAAELAEGEGVTVHTVLVGSDSMVPIPVRVRDPDSGEERMKVVERVVETNPELLETIAGRTGGVAFRAGDSAALAGVFAEIDALEKTEFSSTRLVRYRDRFRGWAIAALSLLLAAAVLEGGLGGTPW